MNAQNDVKMKITLYDDIGWGLKSWREELIPQLQNCPEFLLVELDRKHENLFARAEVVRRNTDGSLTSEEVEPEPYRPFALKKRGNAAKSGIGPVTSSLRYARQLALREILLDSKKSTQEGVYVRKRGEFVPFSGNTVLKQGETLFVKRHYLGKDYVQLIINENDNIYLKHDAVFYLDLSELQLLPKEPEKAIRQIFFPDKSEQGDKFVKIYDYRHRKRYLKKIEQTAKTAKTLHHTEKTIPYKRKSTPNMIRPGVMLPGFLRYHLSSKEYGIVLEKMVFGNEAHLTYREKLDNYTNQQIKQILSLLSPEAIRNLLLYIRTCENFFSNVDSLDCTYPYPIVYFERVSAEQSKMLNNSKNPFEALRIDGEAMNQTARVNSNIVFYLSTLEPSKGDRLVHTKRKERMQTALNYALTMDENLTEANRDVAIYNRDGEFPI